MTVDVDDPLATVERLSAEGYVLRALPPLDAIRASVHAVNTVEEVDGLVGVLDNEW